MKHLILAVVLSLASITAGADNLGMPPFKNVFGDDDRADMTDKRYPWSTIGRLNLPNGLHCSGTLIGHNLVLTAAHCVFKSPGVLFPGDFHFYPQYGNGENYYSRVNYIWWGTDDPDRYRHLDWAILRLDHNLGDTYGWMGVRADEPQTILNTQDIFLIGYSADYREGKLASWVGGCSFTGFTEGFLMHNCDSTRGSSGSAMFRLKNPKDRKTAYIYAVHAAERRDGSEYSLVKIPYNDLHGNIAVPAKEFVDTLIRIKKSEEK